MEFDINALGSPLTPEEVRDYLVYTKWLREYVKEHPTEVCLGHHHEVEPNKYALLNGNFVGPHEYPLTHRIMIKRKEGWGKDGTTGQKMEFTVIKNRKPVGDGEKVKLIWKLDGEEKNDGQE